MNYCTGKNTFSFRSFFRWSITKGFITFNLIKIYSINVHKNPHKIILVIFDLPMCQVKSSLNLIHKYLVLSLNYVQYLLSLASVLSLEYTTGASELYDTIYIWYHTVRTQNGRSPCGIHEWMGHKWK